MKIKENGIDIREYLIYNNSRLVAAVAAVVVYLVAAALSWIQYR